MTEFKIFVDAIIKKLQIAENPYLFDEVVSKVEFLDKSQYRAFLSDLSAKHEYHTAMEKLHKVSERYRNQIVNEKLSENDEMIRRLEKNLLWLFDYVYRVYADQTNAIYTEKIEKMNDKYQEIKINDIQVFGNKEQFLIANIGSLEQCEKLINEGYDKFYSRCRDILSESIKAKYLLANKKQLQNKSLLNALEIKRA